MKTLTKTLLLAGAVAAGVVAMPSGANADSFSLHVNSGPAYGHNWHPAPVRYGPPPHARAHGNWKKHHRWDDRRAYRAGFRHGLRAAERHDYRHGQRVAYGWR